MKMGVYKQAMLVEFGTEYIIAGDRSELKASRDFIKIFDDLRDAVEYFEKIEGKNPLIDSAVKRMIEERMNRLHEISTILKRKWKKK